MSTTATKPVLLVTAADLAPQALEMLGDFEVVFAGKQPTQVMGMFIFLVQKVLVGLVVGSVHSPDIGAGRNQVYMLMGLFIALAIYCAVCKPFLIPIANFFEMIVAFSQFICCGLNLWLLAEDGSVLEFP